MNFNYEHDKFVNKNKAMAKSYSVEQRDRELEGKGFARFQRGQEASCFNCRLKKKCATFRSRQNIGVSGVASVGGHETYVCGRYTAEPPHEKNLSDKQIKSLLKNIKKGR